MHLLAIAGRLGIDLTLDDFDRIGSAVPLLVDLQPAGRFLMEDFHRAGGLLAVLREVARPARPDRADRHRPAAGRLPRRTRRSGTPRSSDRARRPLLADAGIAVLRGNLAPGRRGDQAGGRVAGPAACTAAGRVVFDSIEDFHARIDDPDLDVDADSVLVLRGCGPKGYPGMPEVGEHAAAAPSCSHAGVRDMVRICDGRMSGTAYGTVVLHVAPEAAAGGPLALVRTGDMIILDVPAGGSTSTSPPRSLRAANPRKPAAAALQRAAARLGAAVRRPRHAGRHGRRPGLPRRLQRRHRDPGFALTMSAPTTLLSAVPVPFAANGDLDVKGQETLLRHLKDTGIGGVFIAGTTGEFTALDDDERAVVLSVALEVYGADARVHTRRRRGGPAGRKPYRPGGCARCPEPGRDHPVLPAGRSCGIARLLPPVGRRRR